MNMIIGDVSLKQVERIKLYAAVVIYNNKCEDSITCRALEKIKCENLEIIVADNSTEDYQNKAYCDTNAIIFSAEKILIDVFPS